MIFTDRMTDAFSHACIFCLISKSLELVELQMSHEALRQDLCDQHSAHQRTVEELRRENSESLGKLRETAEQFEWLCEQQRRWMSCVKRFCSLRFINTLHSGAFGTYFVKLRNLCESLVSSQ